MEWLTCIYLVVFELYGSLSWSFNSDGEISRSSFSGIDIEGIHDISLSSNDTHAGCTDFVSTTFSKWSHSEWERRSINVCVFVHDR